MLQARLYKPSKTAMQSGKAKTKAWVLEHIDPDAKYREPVMGWGGTESTSYEASLFFNTLEEALEYAVSRGMALTILSEPERVTVAKSYSENFTKGLRF